MDPKFKAWIEAMGFDVEALSAEQIEGMKANYEGRNVPKQNGKAKIDDVIQGAKAEDARREKIADITAQTIADNPGRDADFINRLEVLSTQAIDAGWDADKFELELARAMRPQSHTVSVRKTGDVKVNKDVLTAAICIAGNLSDKQLSASFAEEVLDAASARYKHGIGLKELYRDTAKHNGLHDATYEVTPEVQAAAFGQLGQRAIHGSTGYSTISLPGIFADSASKFLLEGWGGGEMVWQDVTDTISVRDFKQISQYKLGGNLKYEKVGPGGELKHGTVSETTYTNQAETYGKMFAVTRTDIINDDLGALTRVPLELGYGANDAFNEVFWTEFLENAGNFYHSDNANTSSGTITASTVLATLAAAEAAFLAQTKPNGTPLGILPNVWLVPPLAKRVAMAAVGSSIVVGSTGPTPNANTFSGEYKVVCSAYIANSAYTNYSTVKHYLICRRPGFAPIQTAFLNGRQSPVVETADAAFNTLGVQMRAYHDFGVNKMEYRAVVQGSGA